jgi:hypothetical protein
MCRTNAAGFPDKKAKATSVVGGFRTGDIVRAVVPPSSIKAGPYVGRLAVRATGFCNLKTDAGTIQGVHVRYCRPLQRSDGYRYQKGEVALPSPDLKSGVFAPQRDDGAKTDDGVKTKEGKRSEPGRSPGRSRIEYPDSFSCAPYAPCATQSRSSRLQ